MKKIAAVLLLFYSIIISGEIRINEVLANVKGNESGVLSPGDRNEFVELYNSSDEPVRITDLVISDGDAEDRIILYPCSLAYPGGIITDSMLPPHKYALILDPEYAVEGDTSYFMPYNIDDDAYVFTLSTTTFGSTGLTSSDYLILYDSEGNILDSYGTPDLDDGFPFDPGDGISLEKINPALGDFPSSYRPCADDYGCTPGSINSVYSSGSIIERCYSVFRNGDTEVNVIMKSSGEYRDTLIIKGEKETERIPILTDSMTLLVNPEENGMVNIMTASQKMVKSIITRRPDMKNSICLSEFMPEGDNEWIEIFNPYTLDFECSGLSAENNTAFRFENAVIPAESFLVLCEDTQLLFYQYGRVGVNACQAAMPSQPDREDTFRLIWMSISLDSVIRGCESGGSSIERISNETFGYSKSNWDECIDFSGATPSRENSIRFENEDGAEEIYFSKSILSPESPILFLNFCLDCHSSEVTFRLFSDTGREYDVHPSKVSIPSRATVQFKNLLSRLDDGMYLLVMNISNEKGKYRRKAVFCTRLRD